MEISSSAVLVAKKPILKNLLDALLAEYSYASILACDSKGKVYQKSGSGTSIRPIDWVTECGYVVKVYDGESYGEYAFNQISEENFDDVLKAIKENVMPWKDKLPEGSGLLTYPKIPDEKIEFVKSTECEVHPEELGDKAIIDRISSIREKVVAENKQLVDGIVGVNYAIIHKMFLSPNKDLEQNLMWSEAIFAALALKGQEMKQSFRATGGSCGLECLDELEDKILEAIEDMDMLLKSEQITPGEYDCICDPDVTGLIVHEAFGHGVEMDMFVKDRALAKDYVGEYVASELVTMHDGAAASKNSGFYFFDDEGTIAGDTIVIEKGILKAGMCDAQAGMQLGIKPTGNGRRQGMDHKAYTRMTNTFFEGGNDKLEDMIASIENGFLLKGAGGGMEDPKNWGIQCEASMALEIKDGKLTGKVFAPITMTGYVPELLKSISMMSENVEMVDTGWCGKGHKEYAKVSMGGPYIKARIRLG